MLPGFALRIFRRGNYRHKFGQRFGIFSERTARRLAPGGWIWIHAVSVGEMMVGLKLAQTALSSSPGERVLLSTTTSTGFALARDFLKAPSRAGVELIYFPLDLRVIVRRVLDLVRPSQLILVDKELWPNLVAECYQRQIPVSITNARLSPKSERGFLKWKRWVGPFFGMLDHVCVQEAEDIEQWHRLGVRLEALHHTGSLKFDYAPAASSRRAEFQRLLASVGVSCEAPILLGGSTFPGEEALLVKALLELREEFKDLFLVLVPRHVERTRDVEILLREMGVTYALRSTLEGRTEPITAWPEVLVVNTTGELRDWYSVATVCVIGKSFTADGGQNPSEPILAGRPLICGPRMQNFRQLVEKLVAAHGAIQVPDGDALTDAVAELLRSPAARDQLVANGRAVFAPHEGAYARTVAILLGKG